MLYFIILTETELKINEWKPLTLVFNVYFYIEFKFYEAVNKLVANKKNIGILIFKSFE